METERKNLNRLISPPHKNLVQIHSHGYLDYQLGPNSRKRLPVYIMDMELGGDSLHSFLKRRYHETGEGLRPVEVWEILGQIASAVGWIHKRGVIHRDLKPENRTPPNHTVRPLTKVIQSLKNPLIWKLTDFGISAPTTGYLLSTRENRGTDEYTAPEILHAKPGIPTYFLPVDVYALGLILYETFTGHRVFYSRAEALAVPPQTHRLFPVSVPPGIAASAPVMASSFVTRVLSAPGETGDLVREFWEAVRGMSLTDRRVWRAYDGSVGERIEEINGFLRVMLEVDPLKRPRVDVLEHHFHANLLRCMMETDAVFPPGPL
jgi:serine/threonine protein kinase